MYPKVAPFGYMTTCSRLSGGKIYGCHVQVNQLLTVQKVAVAPFLQRAAAAHWHILYMTRQDIVRQSLSTILAVRRRQWYSYDKLENHAPQTIDPAALHRWLQRRVDHAAIEQAALRDLPHLTIVYERDLLDKAIHQAPMDRVFNYIGVPAISVVAQTERLSGDLRTAIANYDELIASLRGTPFAEYTASGLIVTFQASINQPQTGNIRHVAGEEGILLIDNVQSLTSIYCALAATHALPPQRLPRRTTTTNPPFTGAPNRASSVRGGRRFAAMGVRRHSCGGPCLRQTGNSNMTLFRHSTNHSGEYHRADS